MQGCLASSLYRLIGVGSRPTCSSLAWQVLTLLCPACRLPTSTCGGNRDVPNLGVSPLPCHAVQCCSKALQVLASTLSLCTPGLSSLWDEQTNSGALCVRAYTVAATLTSLCLLGYYNEYGYCNQYECVVCMGSQPFFAIT